MNVPVPVNGSRICTFLLANDLPKYLFKTQSTEWIIKSTTSTGVNTIPIDSVTRGNAVLKKLLYS